LYKTAVLCLKINDLLEMRVLFSSGRICRDDEGGVTLQVE
jgi:hypothetical protein